MGPNFVNSVEVQFGRYQKKIFRRSDLWSKFSHVLVVQAWNVLPLNLLFKQEACRELFLPFFLLFSSGHGDILIFESDQNFQEFQFHLLISMSYYCWDRRDAMNLEKSREQWNFWIINLYLKQAGMFICHNCIQKKSSKVF